MLTVKNNQVGRPMYNRIYRNPTLFILLFLNSAVGWAQHFPSNEALLDLIHSRVQEERAVGIVLGVLEADGSKRIVSYGSSGPNAQPLGEKSVFEIGSITKVFTGILLADMVARDEVSLSDPVAKHLPDEVTMPTRGGKEITLLDLSTHYSALPRLPDNMSPSDQSNPYADYSVEQMYAFLSAHELRRDIGSQYEYSNLGTGLLGHVLALVDSSSYETLVRKRILDPLKMTSTRIALSEDMRHWMAEGHDAAGNVVPLWDLPTLAGAGALRSNMEDMLAFLAANMGPAKSQLERSIKDSHNVQNSLNENMSIAFNWHVRLIGNERIVWHNGGTAGFRTFIGFDPDKNVGAVVLTNSIHGADDVGFHLINQKLPLTEPEAERVEIQVDRNILETYVGNYALAPTFIISVTLEENALFAQATGQQKIQVYPESDTKFFYRVVDAQISFVKNESGEVIHLILHQNGANQMGRKVLK